MQALGELLGDITPSWASAPVLALLASRGTEAPLSAASWTRVSSRAGGGAAAADLPVPAATGATLIVDADAAGDDDLTQPYVNVDGVDPAVSDPWWLLEPCAGATTSAVPSAGSDTVPQGARTHRACKPRGRCWAPTPRHLRPQHVGGGPQQPAQWTGSRGKDSA